MSNEGKFKVGDRVKLVHKWDYAGLKKGQIGTVTSLEIDSFSVNNEPGCDYGKEYWKFVSKSKKKKSVDIADLVQADIAARKKQGIKTYGKPLRANNGRNALQDAYEECLDMACYLKQAIEEQKK